MAAQGGLSGAAVALITIDATLSALLALITGIVLWLVKRRADREARLDRTLTELAGNVRSLQEGMSIGARDAIRELAGRLSTAEDEIDQQGEKIIELRAELRATDRAVEGHIRSAGPIAHPPAQWGPSPG